MPTDVHKISIGPYEFPSNQHQKLFTLMTLAQSQNSCPIQQQMQTQCKNMYVVQNFKKNLAYSSAIKRLRKIIPALAVDLELGKDIKKWKFLPKCCDLLEDDNYAGKYSSRYTEAERISKFIYKEKSK